MRVIHINKYRSKFTEAEQKETRRKAAAKATATNKAKKYAASARSDNALQHTPVTKESPVNIARNILGKRLQEYTMCDGIAWELDGKPTSLNLVIREANRILKANNQPQIDTNKAWVV